MYSSQDVTKGYLLSGFPAWYVFLLPTEARVDDFAPAGMDSSMMGE